MSTPVTVPSLSSITKNSWATIAYGSRIKIHHAATATVLHSHSHSYTHPDTSGQQQVTAFAGNDDNDWWIVKGPHGTPNNYRAGEPVQHGDIIRLEHHLTGRNLHSHSGFPSPLTRQQEVTCFGDRGEGDNGDNWRVELEAGGAWQTGKRLRLIHVNTNHALHSHIDVYHPEWTMNQQEVTCFEGRDDNDWWSVEPFLISTILYQEKLEDIPQQPPVLTPPGEPPIDLLQDYIEFMTREQWYTAYAHVSIPPNEDTSLPIVMLLHGASGDMFHMSDPAKNPGFNYDRQAKIPEIRDHGWQSTPEWGIHSYDLDPLKPVTSWQTALNNAGFRTINYSQVHPRGSLKLPIAQLSQLLADAMNHPQHQGRQFVLLGHSRGGLLARAVVTQRGKDCKFDITRVQQLITLHSPHQGSHVADLAVSIAKMITKLKESPDTDGLGNALKGLEKEVDALAYHDFTVGSYFLRTLAAQEPVPGIQYATFGGNSTIISRRRIWRFTAASAALLPRNPVTLSFGYRWETVPIELGDLSPESLPIYISNMPPELKNGVGDLLVTNESARLPGVPHRVNPLNHAEALWDPDLQHQVITQLKVQAAAAQREITYGSRIKLRHLLTNTGLHSHAHNYSHPGTSGQQQVTAFERTDDNDWWIVKGPHGTPDDYRTGEPVQQGDVIRLEHQLTGRNLHSHDGSPSPLTRQQEVTCFGNQGQGDDNDNWRVELQANGKWQRGKQLRLIHVNTNHALHSHAGHAHPAWTLNQQEVTCFDRRDDNDWWSVFAIKSPPKVRDSEEVDAIPVTPPSPIDRPPVHQP